MARDYMLDFDVQYSEEPKYRNLYEWCLREINDKAEQVGLDWIPWSYGVTFTGVEVELWQTIGPPDRYRFTQTDEYPFVKTDKIDETDRQNSFVEDRHIKAKLRPGFAEQDPRYAPTISMLGTDRDIGEINLTIAISGDEHIENCRVSGFIEYAQRDPLMEQFPDALYIEC